MLIAAASFVITKPIGLVPPPPLCFCVCLPFSCYYLFSLFGGTEWPRQPRPSRPIELWHNRCNTSMRLSWEPLIRPSCSFHQFAPAPLGFLGGMGVRQRGLLYCMWITRPSPPQPMCLPSQWALCPWKPPAPSIPFSSLPSQLPLMSVRSDSIKC